MTCPGPARSSVYQLISLAGWTRRPRLPRPALILVGDDPIIPLANARIAHRHGQTPLNESGVLPISQGTMAEVRTDREVLDAYLIG